MRAAEGQGAAQLRPGSPRDDSPLAGARPTGPPTPAPAPCDAPRDTSPETRRTVSPATARWESLVQADCTEGDEDETVEAMVARLLKARKVQGERRGAPRAEACTAGARDSQRTQGLHALAKSRGHRRHGTGGGP